MGCESGGFVRKVTERISAGDTVPNIRVVHRERVARARQEIISRAQLNRLALTYKALGDQTRLKLVLALWGGEMCVCDLAAFVSLSESAVSHHLRRLKDLVLVRQRRDKQVLYYALDDEHVVDLLRVGLEHVRE
jgi:DNA-binding transcriptional ArsR family regulator